MDNNSNIQMSLDDKRFLFWLENIKGTKLKSALKSGIRKSLNIIKKQAVSNLQTIRWKNGRSVDISKEVIFKNKYGTLYEVAPFKKAVVIKVKKNGLGGRIEIITKNTDKNWNPILKMMENAKGTHRETDGNSHQGIKKGRKAHSTGSIKRTFFSEAIKKTRSEVHNSLQKNLDDAIMRAKKKSETQ